MSNSQSSENSQGIFKINRKTLQELAEIRKDEAEALICAQKYSGAYYLSGYVIELAFKACIAKETKEHDFPPDRKVVEKIYSHNLQKLLESTSLKIKLESEIKNNKKLEVNWNTVKDWDETSRYKKWTKQLAEDMFNSVSDTNEGIFKWIKLHW